MDRRRIPWSAIFYLLCVHVVTVSSTLFQYVAPSAPAEETQSRTGRERNLMLVLPVMQGSNDPSDPRLEFWYTKPPVTMVIEEGSKNVVTSKLPSRASTTTTTTTSTRRYTEAEMLTVDIITTNSPLPEFDAEHPLTAPPPQRKTLSSSRPSNHQDLLGSTTLLPHQNIPNFKNLSNHWQDSFVSFVKMKPEFSPPLPGTPPPPSLHIVSAEPPKWKTDVHKLIEHDKLKFQKPKPRPEVSTIVPSSTRIQFYSDFVPIETGQRKPVPQRITFEGATNKPGLRFPAADRDSQHDSVKVYDMLKKGSIKLSSISKYDDSGRVPVSDREVFDVLREMSLPTDSLFKERTKPVMSVETPSSRATDQWVFTYAPEELSTLPIEVTEATFTEENPSTMSQEPPSTSDDTLADDFKRMLVALGILRDNETTTTTESNELWVDPESFTTDPLSYSKFKKIPIAEELSPIRKDMQSLLNSFGLLPKMGDGNFYSTRVTRQSKELGPKTSSNEDTKKSEVKPQTMFSEVRTPMSKKKSNKKKPTKMFKLPLSLLRGFNNRSSSRRNKLFTVFTPLSPVKRMRKVAHMKSSSPSKKAIPKSTTMKPKRDENSTVSYEDLAESFGGGETAKRDTPDEELTTTSNGLYILFDWNWFLNAGDDDDKKPIRLKFSPHSGDPKRFVPIDFP